MCSRDDVYSRYWFAFTTTVPQPAPLSKDSQSAWHTDMGSYIPYIPSPQTKGCTLLQRIWDVIGRWWQDLQALYITLLKNCQSDRVMKQPFAGIAYMPAWRWYLKDTQHTSYDNSQCRVLCLSSLNTQVKELSHRIRETLLRNTPRDPLGNICFSTAQL